MFTSDGCAARRCEEVAFDGADGPQTGQTVDDRVAAKLAEMNIEASFVRQRPERTARTARTARTVRGRTIEAWKKEIGAKTGEVGVPTPMGSYARGPGLKMATVGNVAQFTVVACDVNGDAVTKGGCDFRVVMRGKAEKKDSQPAVVRTKLIDRTGTLCTLSLSLSHTHTHAYARSLTPLRSARTRTRARAHTHVHTHTRTCSYALERSHTVRQFHF